MLLAHDPVMPSELGHNCPDRNPTSAIVPLKVSELLKILDEDDWYLVVTRGSHRQFKHPTKAGRVTVPGKPSRVLPIGTERSILKQADIDWRTG